MTSIKQVAGLVALGAALALSAAHQQADACGGCFISESETGTQVTGHRMVLSLSQQQTTLYDQFEYAGEPAEFAWVLPINGLADVGLSSDILFETLNDMSGVTIQSPTINCTPQTCPNQGGPSSTASSGAGGGGGGGQGDPVTVLAQETVGPFETVQLESTDPSALNDWLTSHGYNIPSDIQPIIADYVTEGFNFLAMKLVPGQGVKAMRPVRITTQGASPALPLRMVAAGTGATTTMTLWVISEGRYQPANFPWFVINSDELVWDWDSSSSNYTALRQRGYDDTNGSGWLVESAAPFSEYDISGRISDTLLYNPSQSGYGDGQDPTLAEQEAAEDMATLFAGIDMGSLYYTRLRAEASRAALATDLSLEAADSQTPVYRFHDVVATTGTEPSCPPPPDCGDPDTWWPFPDRANANDDSHSGGCATGGSTSDFWSATPLAFFALVLATRRRRRRSS